MPDKQVRTLFLLMVAVFCSCHSPVLKDTGNQNFYDLAGYFKGEGVRLDKQNTPIIKTVSYNGQPETKTVLIKNWNRELDLFIGSDINKLAWKSSYNSTQDNDSIVYTAIDTNLRTRQITIRQKANKVTAVFINNFTKNMLYQTKERLVYYPDSLYYIEKHQYVKLLGTNNYVFTGKFK